MYPFPGFICDFRSETFPRLTSLTVPRQHWQSTRLASFLHFAIAALTVA